MQVLLLCGGHQEVIDVVGDGTELLLNNSPSLHGWHLSRSLRTFLARLVVLFSSSELDVRAAAHIQRCCQTTTKV
jgi:hypothetical protein